MVQNYYMRGALPAPVKPFYDFYAQEKNNSFFRAVEVEKPKPKNKKPTIFDKKKIRFNSLINFKKNNLDMLLKNEELAISYALVESCYTYCQDKNFDLHPVQEFMISERFKENRGIFNSFFDLTKFKL